MKRRLDWRWIGIGTAIMVGLSLIAGLVLVPLMSGPDALPAGPANGGGGVIASESGTGRLLIGALVSFLSFAVGGYIVGTRSLGRTVIEPGISAALAVAISLLIGGAFTLGNLLAGGLIPFLAGLLGGWLGERRQQGRGPIAPPP